MDTSHLAFKHSRSLGLLTLIAALFSGSRKNLLSKQSNTFYQSYRDRGRQQFGFTIKPWMRKGNFRYHHKAG